MSCPSTFLNGVHQCQLTDPEHFDRHRDGATTWTDLQSDENQKKAA